MKWSEVKKRATKGGWELLRHGSEHDIYSHPNKDYQIQLGRHDSEEVKKGLYYKLKRQIGF